MTTTTVDPVTQSLSPETGARPARNVSASFNYFGTERELQDDEMDVLIGATNDVVSCRQPVEDIRGRSDEFNIDESGFAVLKHQSSLLPPQKAAREIDFNDAELIKSVYWNEIKQLLKSAYGCKSVFIVNSSIRDQKKIVVTNPKAPPRQGLGPFFMVHADYMPAGAREHLRAIQPNFYEANEIESSTTPEERETFFRLRDEIIAAEDQAVRDAGLSSHWNWDGQNYSSSAPRYAMFSIWRPLETVRQDPLALLDPRSIDLSRDVKQLPRNYYNRPGCAPAYKSPNALPRPPFLCQNKGQDHRWCYMSNMEPDEVFAIKLYDSEALRVRDGNMPVMCPHSAFKLDDVDYDEARRSCELRVWMIW